MGNKNKSRVDNVLEFAAEAANTTQNVLEAYIFIAVAFHALHKEKFPFIGIFAMITSLLGVMMAWKNNPEPTVSARGAKGWAAVSKLVPAGLIGIATLNKSKSPLIPAPSLFVWATVTGLAALALDAGKDLGSMTPEQLQNFSKNIDYKKLATRSLSAIKSLAIVGFLTFSDSMERGLQDAEIISNPQTMGEKSTAMIIGSACAGIAMMGAYNMVCSAQDFMRIRNDQSVLLPEAEAEQGDLEAQYEKTLTLSPSVVPAKRQTESTLPSVAQSKSQLLLRSNSNIGGGYHSLNEESDLPDAASPIPAGKTPGKSHGGL